MASADKIPANYPRHRATTALKYFIEGERACSVILLSSHHPHQPQHHPIWDSFCNGRFVFNKRFQTRNYFSRRHWTTKLTTCCCCFCCHEASSWLGYSRKALIQSGWSVFLGQTIPDSIANCSSILANKWGSNRVW